MFDTRGSVETKNREEARGRRARAMMLLRPLLREWPCCCTRATLNDLLPSPSFPLGPTAKPSPPSIHSTSLLLSSPRTTAARFRSGGLKRADAPALPDPSEGYSDSDSDADAKKSRNQRKREARRAVQWGMDLASFSNSHIRRILRAVSLDKELFDSLMLAKRLGPDVREGKRRHFNYIGKLLRDVEPDLMDSLINASKANDIGKFREIYASMGALTIEDNYDDDDDEGPHEYVHTATRWFDGLISKDIDITNEVYSVNSVEFDRQELRKLVRKVHSIQTDQVPVEENEGQVIEVQVQESLVRAKRSLKRFLCALAKQLPTE